MLGHGAHRQPPAGDGRAPGPLHGAEVGALSVLAAMLWARVRDGRARRRAARAALPDRRRDGAARARGVRRRSTRPGAPARSAGAATRASSSAGTTRATSWTTLWERWPAFDAELDGLLASPERLVAALRARPRAGAADAARRARRDRPLGARPRPPDARPLHGRRPRVLHGHLGARPTSTRCSSPPPGWERGCDRVRLHAHARRRDGRRRRRRAAAACARPGCATSASRTSARRRRSLREVDRRRRRGGHGGHAGGRVGQPRGRAALAARGARDRRRLGARRHPRPRRRRDPRRASRYCPFPGTSRATRACSPARSRRSPRDAARLTALDGVARRRPARLPPRDRGPDRAHPRRRRGGERPGDRRRLGALAASRSRRWRPPARGASRSAARSSPASSPARPSVAAPDRGGARAR